MLKRSARLLASAVFLFASTSLFAAAAASSPLLGDWTTPNHATVRIHPCGDALCLTLIQVDPKSPYKVDGQNPDASLRSRPLCGLEIGSGFQPQGQGAEGGHLYDPESGNTYKGNIELKGHDELHLRGYVGISLFGRSQTWHRAPAGTQSCQKA